MGQPARSVLLRPRWQRLPGWQPATRRPARRYLQGLIFSAVAVALADARRRLAARRPAAARCGTAVVATPAPLRAAAVSALRLHARPPPALPARVRCAVCAVRRRSSARGPALAYVPAALRGVRRGAGLATRRRVTAAPGRGSGRTPPESRRALRCANAATGVGSRRRAPPRRCRWEWCATGPRKDTGTAGLVCARERQLPASPAATQTRGYSRPVSGLASAVIGRHLPMQCSTVVVGRRDSPTVAGAASALLKQRTDFPSPGVATP